MKIKTLVTTVILLFPVLGQAAGARLVDVSEVGQCKKLGQQVCTTTKSDADTVCLAMHQEEAANVNADAIVLVEQEQVKQRRPSLMGNKTVIKTDITADYYDCGFPEPIAPVKRTVNRDLYDIEERLEVLESLKSKGLVTEQEYNQKRQDILSDL